MYRHIYLPRYLDIHVPRCLNIQYTCTKVFGFSCTKVFVYTSTRYSCTKVFIYQDIHVPLYSCTKVFMYQRIHVPRSTNHRLRRNAFSVIHVPYNLSVINVQIFICLCRFLRIMNNPLKVFYNCLSVDVRSGRKMGF